MHVLRSKYLQFSCIAKLTYNASSIVLAHVLQKKKDFHYVINTILHALVSVKYIGSVVI